MELNTEILAHLSAFHDSREGIRLFAARKLASYGEQVAPLLIDLLKETRGFTQDCAAVSLQTMGDKAIPYLVEALAHENRTIRWNAAAILSNMGEKAKQAMDAAKASNFSESRSVAAS